MPFTDDILTNLAANLATDLLTRAGGWLHARTFGDAETQALRRAWEAAFRALLEALPAGTAPLDADLVEHILRDFVQAGGVAEALLALAAAGGEPPLALLRARFDALDYDRATLPVDFDAALTALTRGLADALLAEAVMPPSPLYNRVSLGRVLALRALLQEQGHTLAQIADRLRQLESGGRVVYNTFVQHAQGMAVGEGALAQIDPHLRPLVERLLARMDTLFAPPAYTSADLESYLQAVVDQCKDIRLPYATEQGATIPLERVYVALKADRSAPAERQASRMLLEQLVQEQRQGSALPEAAALARIAILNPYAARYRIYDPQVQEALRRAAGEAQERTYHLAEIVRRYRWLVLLGDPGSGKSTLARWLALHLARALQREQATVTVPGAHVRPDAGPGTQETLGAARLPVLVHIADYAATRWPPPGRDTGLKLAAYLGRHLGDGEDARARAFCALVREHLAAGRVTLLLDGLDEVTDRDQRVAIAAEIEGLLRTWGCDAAGRCPLDPRYHITLMVEPEGWAGNQIIVTSRIVGYHLCPLHAALPHYVIQPLDDAAVQRFCENWAAYYALPECAEALAQAVLRHPNPNVREQMARNPLLLTILAQVFQQDPAAGLPARRAELYGKAAEAVFKQRLPAWERLAGSLGGRDLAAVLARITAHVAFHLHANPEYPAALVEPWCVRGWLRTAVREEPALSGARREDDVVSDLLAAASQLSGFFVARGEGAYGFLHRQFQEYFAARHLVAQMKEGNLAPYLGRSGDPAWREVLLLAVGILEDREIGAPPWVTPLLDGILDTPDPTGGLLPHNLLLVADALRELQAPPAAVVRRMAEGLIAAYRCDDESRFAVLHERIKRAFAALPRQVGREDPVSQALAAPLAPSSFALLRTGSPGGEGARFTRLAAAELVVETKWHTPQVAQALSAAWQAHVEPAGTLLAALQGHYEAQPEHFAHLDLPFRRALAAEPALWAAVRAHAHWGAVVRALYLAPWAGLEVDALVRDSPLTADLLRLLRSAPEDEAALRAYLWEQWECAGETPAGRDAGLALAYLGEERLALLLAEGGENRPRQRAILAATYLARDRDLALARDRDLARALDLARDLARDLDLDRTRDRDLARDLDLEYLREIIATLRAAQQRALAQVAAEAVQQALASALENALRLEALLQTQAGVWAVWRALDAAREAQPPALPVWAAAPRPALDLLRLRDLRRAWKERHASALDWPDLLPRLQVERLADEEMVQVREGLLEWLAHTTDHVFSVVRGLSSVPAHLPLLAPHLALLLAEMDLLTPQTVPLLCACLQDPADPTRYRAQRALNRERQASALGRETIEQMARCKQCSGETPCPAGTPAGCWRVAGPGSTSPLPPRSCALADTYLDWALKEIAHDEADWLRAWAAADGTAILGRIYRLAAAAWPAFLDLLATAAPPVQAALLDSASWLARLGRVPEEQAGAFTAALLALAASAAPEVHTAAITALGHLRERTLEVVERLLALTDTINRNPDASSTDYALRITPLSPAWPPAPTLPPAPASPPPCAPPSLPLPPGSLS